MSFVGGPGIFCTMKNEDVVMGVHCYARDLTENKAIGKLRPAMYDGIRFGQPGFLVQRNGQKRQGQEGCRNQRSSEHHRTSEKGRAARVYRRKRPRTERSARTLATASVGSKRTAESYLLPGLEVVCSAAAAC